MSFSGNGNESSTVNGSTDVATSNLANGQVLTWNTGPGKWTNLGVGSAITITQQSGTAYTPTLADAGTEIEMTNAGVTVVTIPAHSTTAWPNGSNFNVRQMGTGQVSIAGANGVTLRSPNGTNIANQYSTATVICSSQDVWIVDGGVST